MDKDRFSIANEAYKKCEAHVFSQAEHYFKEKNYSEALLLYELLDYDFLNDYSDQRYTEISKQKNYLLSQLLTYSPNKVIDETHPLHCKLIEIRKSLLGKISFIDRMNLLSGRHPNNIEVKKKLTEDEININRSVVFGLYQKLRFKKYQGKKLIEIAQLDANYLFWCVINLIGFTTDYRIFMLEETMNCSLYLPALEISLIKNELFELWNYEDEIEGLKLESKYSNEEFDPSDDYSEQDMIDDAFEGDASNIWNKD